MPEPTQEDFEIAIRVRPHHGPCEDPRFPECRCSAAGDRAMIAQALADRRLALRRQKAALEEAAVFDFLNWLAPQNIELHRLIPGGGCSEVEDGALWERWKTERDD